MNVCGLVGFCVTLQRPHLTDNLPSTVVFLTCMFNYWLFVVVSPNCVSFSFFVFVSHFKASIVHIHIY